jgi:predicted HicB family RNase H-like nuclease
VNSPKQDNRQQITLRIPKDLDKAITDKAKKLGISKNAYIIMILKQFVEEYAA